MAVAAGLNATVVRRVLVAVAWVCVCPPCIPLGKRSLECQQNAFYVRKLDPSIYRSLRDNFGGFFRPDEPVFNTMQLSVDNGDIVIPSGTTGRLIGRSTANGRPVPDCVDVEFKIATPHCTPCSEAGRRRCVGHATRCNFIRAQDLSREIEDFLREGDVLSVLREGDAPIQSFARCHIDGAPGGEGPDSPSSFHASPSFSRDTSSKKFVQDSIELLGGQGSRAKWNSTNKKPNIAAPMLPKRINTTAQKSKPTTAGLYMREAIYWVFGTQC